MQGSSTRVKRRKATRPPRFAKIAGQPTAVSATPLDRTGTVAPIATPVIEELPDPPHSITPDDVQANLAGRAWVSLLCGLGALALAGAGEALVESHNTTILSLLLYLAAIALFAWSALLIPRDSADLPTPYPSSAQPVRSKRRSWAKLWGGILAAIVLNALSFFSLRDDLKSGVGLVLWLASIAVLAATCIAFGWRVRWSARWGTGARMSPRSRLFVLVLIVLVLLVAAIARFVALDVVPFGINADEGDRAATSMQIIRGTNTDSIFADGWYQISMMYFTMLSWLLKVLGIGFAQARVFGGIASLLGCGALIWIGARHFSWRVGLMAGGLFALLAIALQFARETSEAGPTATLWAFSIAFFLEAARTGKLWAWVGAGLAGGFSIYFYPTGRLWPAFAALFCIYLLVHGLGGRRLAIARGVALAAVAAVMIMMPFVVNGLNHPETFTLRANDTSIFTQNNATRLDYYKPEWSTPQLVVEQTIRSVGAFNQVHDEGGFWPTNQPIMYGLLAVLTLLGLGCVCLRVRDPRYAALALWFWLGLVGVIVTVETPNYQRLAVAVPVMALFPALVLDNLARRAESSVASIAHVKTGLVKYARAGATALVAIAILWLCIDQGRYYFVDYAKVDRWPQPTIQGTSVRDQGDDTLVITLGRSYHMVNSGWVRLLAPDTPHGGMRTPDTDLPLSLPATTKLAFQIYPNQDFYLPYLRDIYPTGTLRSYSHPTEGTVVTMYKVPQSDWAAMQGAVAHLPSGQLVHVPTLGAVPPDMTSFPAQVTWTAGLRVPTYWNYGFRIGPGPSLLNIDGTEVLNVPRGASEMTTTVSLAAGDHAISFEGEVTAANTPPAFEWAQATRPDNNGVSAPVEWSPVSTDALSAQQSTPEGLYAVLQQAGKQDMHFFSHTVAHCCLSEQVQDGGKPYTVTWSGALDAPVTGAYTMTLLAEGAATLQLDGSVIIATGAASDTPSVASVSLPAGKHTVELMVAVDNTRGDMEWRWTPPGGEDSIVPPSALTPPPNVGVGPPLDLKLYRGENVDLQYTPLETVR
ncbi:MAG TPA: PA14 domain-containing protein [Chloroflexia bacterium]|nr:PA14 domain-containing protein [Chloroflexia bacterium]